MNWESLLESFRNTSFICCVRTISISSHRACKRKLGCEIPWYWSLSEILKKLEATENNSSQDDRQESSNRYPRDDQLAQSAQDRRGSYRSAAAVQQRHSLPRLLHISKKIRSLPDSVHDQAKRVKNLRQTRKRKDGKNWSKLCCLLARDHQWYPGCQWKDWKLLPTRQTCWFFKCIHWGLRVPVKQWKSDLRLFAEQIKNQEESGGQKPCHAWTKQSESGGCQALLRMRLPQFMSEMIERLDAVVMGG